MIHKFPLLVALTKKFSIFLKRNDYEILSWTQNSSSKKLTLLENDLKIYSPTVDSLDFPKNPIYNFDYILCSGEYQNYLIIPDENFIKKIQSDILISNKQIKIVKLGTEIDINNPFRINNLEIFNKINIKKSYFEIIEILNNMIKKRDIDIKKSINLMKYFLFEKLLLDNNLKSIFNKILTNYCLLINSEKYYDKENDFLEFKDKKFYEGKGREYITEKLLNIAKDYFHLRFKFVIIGIDDKDKIDGIDKKYIHSDWIGYFEDQLNIFLNSHNKEAFVQHISIKQKTTEKFLIIVIFY